MLLLDYQAPLRRPKTRQCMIRVLDQLAALERSDGVPLIATTADHSEERSIISAFIASRGPRQNRNTTVGLLSYVRAACNYAVGEELATRLAVRPPALEDLVAAAEGRPQKSTTSRSKWCNS